MKNRRLPLLVSAVLVSALSVGALAPAHAAKGDKPDHPRGGGVNRRMLKAIEDKTGKPLTDDQKSKLADAAKVRQDAIDAATDKFLSDAAAVTGLTVDDLREIDKPTHKPMAPKPDDAAPPAPVPAPAPAP